MRVAVGDIVTTKQRRAYSRGVVETVKPGGNVIIIRWLTGDALHDDGAVLAHRVDDVIRLEATGSPSGRS